MLTQRTSHIYIEQYRCPFMYYYLDLLEMNGCPVDDSHLKNSITIATMLYTID